MQINNFVELTPDFENALSKNFCAMKYFHGLSEYEQMSISEKAKRLSKEEMKEYVTHLGNIIT